MSDPLDNLDLDRASSTLKLQRVSSESITSEIESKKLIRINSNQSFSSPEVKNMSSGSKSSTGSPSPRSDSSNANDEKSPGTRDSTSATRRSKRSSTGKPSSALMQAKLNAQLRRSNTGDEISVIVKDHFQPASDSKDVIRKDTAIIYDLSMVEHRNLWDSSHPERPERLSSILERCEALNLLERCKKLVPREATEEEILALHTKEHFDKLRDLFSNVGDDMNAVEEIASEFDAIYFHPSTFNLALLSCGSTIDLINAVLSGKVQNGCAIIRPPGHHAMKSEYCGYCYFNNVALAAHSALANKTAKKILIVDFDAHHGQATQQMFYDDPRVLYFSTHRYEHGNFWPNLEESNFHWIGDKDGLGFNINVPLNETGMGNSEFLTIWHNVLLPIAYQFNPDLVIVSAGFDAALGCPEGQMVVTPQCYPHLISPLMGLANGKVAVILEGGYCLKSLSEGAALTLRALLGDPCPLIQPISSPTPVIVDTILNSICVLWKYWDLYHLRDKDENVDSADGKSRLHTPVVKYDWTEPKPTRYPTRDCYPVPSEEETRALDMALDKLIINTSLTKAVHRVGLVYDDIMQTHRNMQEPGHPERPERIASIHACHVDFSLIKRCYQIDSRKATEEELRLIHTEKHILRMRNSQKLGSKDLANLESSFNSIFLNSSTYGCALLAAGSVLQVVDAVLNGECQSGVAIVRPPGHHAEADYACGFCIFNNVALAAKYALEVHDLKRILIVDWDVHHGNGIQRMFEDDPRVLYISIHRYDRGTFFPCSTDADFTEVGTGKGEGFNVNIPWNRPAMGDTEYLLAFTKVILPISYEFAPELVLVSAGFDAARGDPLGGCKVSPEGYAHMTHLLSTLANGKLVLALEGGYNLRSISYSMTLCTKALLGDPIPPLTLNSKVNESARISISNVLSVHSKYWKVLSPFQKVLPEADILESGKYQDVNTMLKQMESLQLNPNPSVPMDDSINANENPSLQIPQPQVIPDPPPASGEPSSSVPTLIRTNALHLPVRPDISQTAVGGGENVTPEQRRMETEGEAERSPDQEQEEEELLGAVGGSNADPAIQAMQNVLRDMEEAERNRTANGMYLVRTLDWCPHLGSIRPVPNCGLDCAEPCQECLSTQENWTCLTCYGVFCSRYIREHMYMHQLASSHPLCLSYSDLSVWCYFCKQYIDCEDLRPAKGAAHRNKFGEDLPYDTSSSSSSP